MPDVNSIPFRQANGNGHYESKQLPNDNTDFLAILGLPISLGNVTSVTVPSRDGQLVQYWQTGGLTIKGSTAIGIVDLVDGVVTVRLSPTGDIVGTTAIQTLRNKTIENSSIVAPSGLTKSDVGLGNVDNTADTAKPVSAATQLALNLKENTANKNAANGYAGLDAGGKVVVGQLPATVQGSVSYQGTWNATTGVPTIPAASAANKGWYYVVSVAGSVAVGGVADWGVGDWLVSNGAGWDKVDNTDAVTSVAGKTGVVVLAKADVGLANVDNTSDDQKNSAAGTLTNKTISGQANTLTVRLDADVANNLPPNRLNNGIGATNQTWWRGDGQWASPAGAGDVVGPAGAADGEMALYSLATGKLIKRAAGSGFVKVLNGVYLTPVDDIGTELPPGSVVQSVYAEQKGIAGGFTTIVGFTTRPAATAGSLVLQVPITLKYANSRVFLDFSAQVSANIAVTLVGFFAVSDNANAIQARAITTTASQMNLFTMSFEYAPGSTGSRTYSFRLGPASASTVYLNALFGTGEVLGAWSYATLRVQEIKQ